QDRSWAFEQHAATDPCEGREEAHVLDNVAEALFLVHKKSPTLQWFALPARLRIAKRVQRFRRWDGVPPLRFFPRLFQASQGLQAQRTIGMRDRTRRVKLKSQIVVLDRF